MKEEIEFRLFYYRIIEDKISDKYVIPYFRGEMHVTYGSMQSVWTWRLLVLDSSGFIFGLLSSTSGWFKADLHGMSGCKLRDARVTKRCLNCAKIDCDPTIGKYRRIDREIYVWVTVKKVFYNLLRQKEKQFFDMLLKIYIFDKYKNP